MAANGTGGPAVTATEPPGPPSGGVVHGSATLGWYGFPTWGRRYWGGEMGAFKLALRLGVIATLAALSACAADRDPVMSDPSFYQNLTTVDAKVDAKMAASMISGYRANNGLTAVTVDPEL